MANQISTSPRHFKDFGEEFSIISRAEELRFLMFKKGR